MSTIVCLYHFFLFVIELFVLLRFITSHHHFGILKLFLYFLDSRNRIGKIDTSVPFRDFRNSNLSNNHINTRQTYSVCYHQSHHGDLKAGNNKDDMRDRQDSRYVSAGSINMSRNIYGISLIESSALVLGISNIPWVFAILNYIN